MRTSGFEAITLEREQRTRLTRERKHALRRLHVTPKVFSLSFDLVSLDQQHAVLTLCYPPPPTPTPPPLQLHPGSSACSSGTVLYPFQMLCIVYENQVLFGHFVQVITVSAAVFCQYSVSLSGDLSD